MEHWLGIDKLESMQSRRMARFLYSTLFFAGAIAALSMLLGVVDGFDRNDLLTLLGFVVCLALLLLARFGYLDIVGWLLPLLSFGVVTMLAVLNDRLFDETLMLYPALIAMAGLLAGRRAVVVFTLLTVATILAIGFWQISSSSAVLTYLLTSYRIVLMLIFLCGSGGLLYILASNTEAGVRVFLDEQQSLERANQELQKMGATLEAQVTERTYSAEVARQEAEMVSQAMETQAWLATGQAELSEIMHGEQDIHSLADHISRQVCRYLSAQVGVLYVLDGDELLRAGGYALPAGQPERLKIGQGLVGRAAQERSILVLEKDSLGVSDYADAPQIVSGLGSTPARRAIVAPFMEQNRLVGVMLLGALDVFDSNFFLYLKQVQSSISVAFLTAQARQRVNQLMAETQQQALELSAQEEELRAANEQLSAQTDSLSAAASSGTALA